MVTLTALISLVVFGWLVALARRKRANVTLTPVSKSWLRDIYRGRTEPR